MMQDAARTIAERIAKGAPEGLADEAFVERAFLAVLNRLPDEFERKQCAESLPGFRALTRSQPTPKSADPARIQIVAALLNHNDFVTVR
jgi:hypothetical protein